MDKRIKLASEQSLRTLIIRSTMFSGIVFLVSAVVDGQEFPGVQPTPPIAIGETPTPARPNSEPLPPTIARPVEDVEPSANALPRPVLPSPMANEQPQRPSLGIVAEERPDKTGLTIIEIRPGSPADSAGVRLGDLLTRLHGRQTRTIEDVSNALSTLRVGDPTTIEVSRNGSLYELKAVMSDAPPPTVDDSPLANGSSTQGRAMTNERGVLGITVEDAGRSQAGSGALRGALVTSVVAGSPAESIGLRPGDIVVSIDGQVTYGARELTDYMQTARSGDEIEIGYYQDRVLHRTPVTLAGSGEPTAGANDFDSAGIPTPRALPDGRMLGRPESNVDDLAPIVIGPGSSVGDILEGVGRTIDRFMDPRNNRGPINPQRDSSRRSPDIAVPSIPTPSTRPEPRSVPVPPPLSNSETKPSGSGSGSDSAEVVELRRQMQQMLQRMEMLERELEKAKQQQ